MKLIRKCMKNMVFQRKRSNGINATLYFLDKISDDETTPFKRVYEQNGMQIMVGIVSNAHFRKIHNKKDIVYSVMVIHNLIPPKPQ
ncbi:hypothetical protein AAY77_01940 [Providencia rettgeri]|nr:hypothetical protein AAY77_01940 [Providencia rettgeri]